MYINPFAAGVVFTILVEVGISLIYAWCSDGRRDKK